MVAPPSHPLRYPLHTNPFQGPIVRLAPNRYSISDPTAIRTIYGPGSKFSKSDFYRPFGALDETHADLFSERINAKHALQRRHTANMYSMSSLVMYEPFVDKVNSEFMAAISQHARTERAFDLFTWMQFYAFDVIGEITIGRSFGLIEAGNDKNGLLHAIHVTGITYSSNAGLVPEIHPLIVWLQDALPFSSPWKAVQGAIGGEISKRTQGETFSDRQDFLEKCTELKKAGKIDHATMFNAIGANIGAGSDTTGITLTAIIYYLMKNPACLQKLRLEIDTAEQEGRISSPLTFKEGQALPYLQAVIKEALRLHPAVGQILARIVPEGGAELAGRFFPAGVSYAITNPPLQPLTLSLLQTVVGVNAWVIHNDAAIWGADIHDFNPGRWLEVDPAQLSSMEHNLLAVCIDFPPAEVKHELIVFQTVRRGLKILHRQEHLAAGNDETRAFACEAV
jgi:cytochrome P450